MSGKDWFMPERTDNRAGESVFAILVLYRKALEESLAWRSLMAARSALANKGRFYVIIYDNSPSPAETPELPPFASMIGDPHNRGLAHAYNAAFTEALAGNYEWLLTLDQDTAVPENFLEVMLRHACAVGPDATISAIVPQLSEGDILLSPRRVHFARTTAVTRGYVGTAAGELHAFNSAALWRTQALKRIGGFCEYFSLDHLDIWMHRQLHRAGYRVFVAGDLQLQHNLSLLDYKTRVTPERYRGFLMAESAFTDICKGGLERAALNGRLLIRYFMQCLRREAPEIRALTLRELRYRLVTRKARRIAQWKEGLLRSPLYDPGPRPAVSVCMAAYNGDRYISEQLQSILSQLTEADEVIVVDDASTDRTRECVRAFGDSRIRLIEHKTNQGVLRTFEDAIRCAGNAIIFLSDQDDIWRSDKVGTIVHAFQANPEADIVVSDAALINRDGLPLGGSYYAQRGRFDSGLLTNIVRCRYLGCTMAFRSHLRKQVLPFPRSVEILHDLWIGTVNAMVGGHTCYLPLPLVWYRRHNSAVTGNTPLSFSRRFGIRFSLCRSLFEHWLQGRRKSFRESAVRERTLLHVPDSGDLC